ncbi:PKD-like domain-containing protein [Chitinophaga sp. SYP-B3965]|uniref:PKD-like domain-containing protein n=1 Tax=Chitinophaga sp. SYP-B3965 TaxID=2663120 RepID=UPI001564D574|nr:PKD-like domain-containing protein [Chitinophaga sp. SYP-B3965]
MKRIVFLQLLSAVIFLTSSCRKEQYQAPSISGVGSDTIVLNIGDKMVLAPSITNTKGNGYTWLVNKKEVATGQLNYTFEAKESGNFEVTFKVNNKGGTDEQSFKIEVEKVIAISIADQLTVPMCDVIDIAPTVTGPDRADYEYQWSIGDSVIGKTRNLSFISPSAGTYALTLRATAGKQTTTSTRNITVSTAQYVQNAYTVLEYAPAPGKLHNWAIIGNRILWDLGYEYPLPYNDFLAKATEKRKTDVSTSLFVGSWGGYATFKFDHTVVNVPGKPDLELTAFFSNRDLPAVYVAYDFNKNGKPDDNEWYETKNADFGLEDTLHYEMTFTYNKTETDTRRVYTYYNWTDNKTPPVQGEILTNKTFSSATVMGKLSTRGFFPGYYMDINTKQMVLLDGWKSSFSRKGKRMTKDLTGAVSFSQKLNIDIDMAVNDKGEPVQLPGINFVKVRKAIYVIQQDFISNGGKMTDFNMDEERMLQVGAILDKHLIK